MTGGRLLDAGKAGLGGARRVLSVGTAIVAIGAGLVGLTLFFKKLR